MANQPSINILAVDDVQENLISLGSILEEQNLNIDYAHNGNEALGRLLGKDYALVLLDVQMPGMDGFEVARLMRGSERTRHIPIIFLTAINKEDQHINIGYDSGAVDYLFKPIQPEILRSKVNVFVDLYKQKVALEEITIKLETTISELISSKESLKAAKQTAEQASKTKSEFLANMSHELRTPLNGIIGMAELALMDKLDDIQADRVQTIKQSGESLLEILNEILDISKIEADKMVLESISFNIEEVVEKVARMLAVKAHEKGLELICEVDPDVPYELVGDPVRLRQIMFNLAGNSIKFTHEGYVKLHIRSLGQTSDNTHKLCIDVADTGIGIKKENIDNLFESFSQADTSTTRKYGGTGLGLPITKRLVELMNGHIEVNSEQGKGSTFSCYITLDFNHMPPPLNNFPFNAAVYSKSKKNAAQLKQTLQKLGLEVQLIDNCKICLEAIKNQDLADYVFIDQALGDDISEILNQIRALENNKHPAIVLLLSAAAKTPPDLLGNHIRKLLYKPVLTHSFRNIFIEDSGITCSEKREKGKEILKNGNDSVRILLAEDNLINQKLAQGFMKMNGWDVTIANNGVEALEWAGKQNFDLIFMDVQMPEMDGLNATREIRGQKIETPIVAMTAHAMKGDKEKCLQAGMDDYLTKPICNDNLIEKVNKFVLNKRREETSFHNEMKN